MTWAERERERDQWESCWCSERKEKDLGDLEVRRKTGEGGLVVGTDIGLMCFTFS